MDRYIKTLEKFKFKFQNVSKMIQKQVDRENKQNNGTKKQKQNGIRYYILHQTNLTGIQLFLKDGHV